MTSHPVFLFFSFFPFSSSFVSRSSFSFWGGLLLSDSNVRRSDEMKAQQKQTAVGLVCMWLTVSNRDFHHQADVYDCSCAYRNGTSLWVRVGGKMCYTWDLCGYLDVLPHALYFSRIFIIIIFFCVCCLSICLQSLVGHLLSGRGGAYLFLCQKYE